MSFLTDGPNRTMVPSEFVSVFASGTRRRYVRHIPIIPLLSTLMLPSMAAATAEHTQLGQGSPPGKLSVGAGYEHYIAQWDGRHSTNVEVLQDRFYVRGVYQPSRRLRVGARLGAANLSAPDLSGNYFWNHIDYGYSSFGSVDLNWTPLGAVPGGLGGALDILFEVSAFTTYTADWMEGWYDGFGTRVDYEAYPEVSSMWEGRLAILVAAHSGYFRFGAGPMLLQSGAETRTHFRISWTEGVWEEVTETDYFTTRNELGMVYALRFSPGLAIVIDAEAVWTAGGPLFKISLYRIL